jgi:hypothetical protein
MKYKVIMYGLKAKNRKDPGTADEKRASDRASTILVASQGFFKLLGNSDE